MTSPLEILRSRGLSPQKRLGQNFLHDARVAEAIAEAAAPRRAAAGHEAAETQARNGTVLEIGPGLGALTAPLLARAEHVIAIERDEGLVPLLRERLADEVAAGRLEIVVGDATEASWIQLLEDRERPRAIAGNVPYLITGRLIEMAVHAADHLDRAVFMVQKEVADRLLAGPGTKTYGALSVFVQAAFTVTRVLVVRRGAFFPPPEVDSAVVLLTPQRPRRAQETEAFRTVVRMAFGQRRKTLRNAWRGMFGWSGDELVEAAKTAGIALDARGETLDVEAFARMARLAPGELNDRPSRQVR